GHWSPRACGYSTPSWGLPSQVRPRLQYQIRGGFLMFWSISRARSCAAGVQFLNSSGSNSSPVATDTQFLPVLAVLDDAVVVPVATELAQRTVAHVQGLPATGAPCAEPHLHAPIVA